MFLIRKSHALIFLVKSFFDGGMPTSEKSERFRYGVRRLVAAFLRRDLSRRFAKKEQRQVAVYESCDKSQHST